LILQKPSNKNAPAEAEAQFVTLANRHTFCLSGVKRFLALIRISLQNACGDEPSAGRHQSRLWQRNKAAPSRAVLGFFCETPRRLRR